MNKGKLAALTMCIAAAAYGLVNAYHVEPIKAAWSGWTLGEDGYVSQQVTCCWDSLAYVELFAGDSGSTGGDYRVGVLDDGAEVAYAGGVQRQATSWVMFDEWTFTGTFTKGKQYEFRFTRSGTDSINYYYQNDEAYGYGDIKVGNDIIIGRDLCMRAYGVMDPEFRGHLTK
jgi:hypothetical protein